MAVDLVAEARSVIQAALRDIEGEIRSLERALAGLGDHQQRTSTPPAAPKRRRRRRAKPGQRRDQFLAAVREQPGISVAQAAKKLGVSPPNALYALAKRLINEGEVTKRGAGYALKGAAGTTAAKSTKPKAKRGRGKARRGKVGRRSSGTKAAASPAKKK
jgi:transposase-like protein